MHPSTQLRECLVLQNNASLQAMYHVLVMMAQLDDRNLCALVRMSDLRVWVLAAPRVPVPPPAPRAAR